MKVEFRRVVDTLGTLWNFAGVVSCHEESGARGKEKDDDKDRSDAINISIMPIISAGNIAQKELPEGNVIADIMNNL